MTDMHVRHTPGDDNRPAIALHCMMGTGSYWAPIAKDLGGRIDLRAPDFPSHGRSPKWEDRGLDYHTDITRQVAGMIDRPLDLIGHSLGATVALRIAVGAPEAVRSLTLIEPVLFAASPDDEQMALFRIMHEALDKGDRAEAVRAFLDCWGVPGTDMDEAAANPRFQEQIGLVVSTNDALVEDRFNILRPDGLEAIDAPVMIIMGGDSPKVIPGIADTLAARLPDVARASVPGAGHMLPLSHREAVSDLIAMNLDRA